MVTRTSRTGPLRCFASCPCPCQLPAAAAGKVVVIKNSDAANAVLKVYPATGDKINSGTATTGSLNMAAKTSTVLVAIDATDWFSVPLLPS